MIPPSSMELRRRQRGTWRRECQAVPNVKRVEPRGRLTPAQPRQYDRVVKRRLERLFLGWVMAVAAFLLDRRLRRVR
jgi:hypothetical protein